ncbi:reverse transcriptase domain-containing protein [Tanacetum coccineum]
MSSASSTVTYTSVDTDSKPGRAFWPADEELSDGGSPWVIVYGYDGLPIQPVAPPSPDYIPGPEDPQAPLVPQDEDEREPMFVQAHDPDYVPEPIYPEYIPLEDEHVFPAEEQPLPPWEEHLALADPSDVPVVDPVPPAEDTKAFEADEPVPTPPSPPAYHTTARISIRPEAPILLPPEEEVERLFALPTPTPLPLISLSPPTVEERLARCLAAPALPSSPLPRLPHPYGSPNYVHAPLGFKAAMGRLIASSPLPPPVPASLPLPSPPLPPLPSSPLPALLDSLFIPPVDRREDIPEAEQPPRKRLWITTPASRYEVGESSTAIPRPTGGHRVDYGFIGTMEAESRRKRAKTVGYGIRDTWVDPRETAKEVTPVTLEGVNTRDRQTQIYQTVEALVDDRQYHYEIARLLDQEALVSCEAWAYSMGLSSAIAALIAQVSSLQGHLATTLGEIRALQAREQARADAPEDTATGPNRVSYGTCPNHTSFRELSTNGHGDGSHNSGIGIRGATRTLRECTYKEFLNCYLLNFKGTEGVVVLSQWFEKMESVFHISNCAPENQVKFATCTFIGSALSWWNSHKKAVTQDVAYGMDWKALKKMMMVKYCLKGEIKKLEIELWNLKESDEVEKYVDGLLDMIRGNGNQQQNKRQNTGRAYTAGPGEKKEYTGSQPLCTKCNYHHKGPCAHRCNKCKKVGHLDRDCRSSGSNGNNNNHRNFKATQKAVTCYECGVQGHIRTDCPKLKNGNCSNQVGPKRQAPPRHHVFLANVTSKETKDKSGEKRLEDVPIVQDFPEIYPTEGPLYKDPVPHLVELPSVLSIRRTVHFDVYQLPVIDKLTVKNPISPKDDDLFDQTKRIQCLLRR